jgi:hypothetical protein
VAWLGGGTRTLAAGHDGKLFVLSRGKATRIAVDIRPLAASPSDRLLIERGGVLELVVLRGQKLVRLAEAPADLAAASVLALLDGKAQSLVVLRDGSSRRFAAGAWSEVGFRSEPPAETTAPAANPPARVGVATTEDP